MDININLKNIRKVINNTFFPLLFNKDRFLVLRGSAGSGKSAFIVMLILLRILIGYKTGIKHNILCMRKTAASIRESVFKEFNTWIDRWGLSELVTINKTLYSFEFSNGSRIISMGCDDEEKLKSISGITTIWIEEANQLSLKDFKVINDRLRGIIRAKQQIMLTFNPISKLSWIYNYFFVNKKHNATLHHSTWRDNPHNGKVYEQEMMAYKEIDENHWRIYSEGEWGSLKDLIYSNYNIMDKFPSMDTFHDSCYGLDFGFNHPSSLIFVGEKDGEYYIKECLYQTKLTNTELIDEVKKIISPEEREDKYIYYDTAEPARATEFYQAGFLMRPADKSVKDGIDFCRRKTLHIDPYSVNLITELQSYKNREDKDGNVLDEPVKFKDDAVDGMRYGMYTHFGNLGIEPGFYTY